MTDEKTTVRQLTAAQETAICEHKRNLIVVAGAGSGKTFVLVERFLSLLDKNPDWPLNALVAITFTKKAAQEMRDRVRRALEQRLVDTADKPVEQAIWAERVAAMTSARIDTIHGLCASILRSNAAEAGVDPGFEVLDEVDSRLLLDDSIDDVLQKAAQNNDAAAHLFTEYDTQAIRQILVKLVGEDIPDMPDDVVMRWQDRWNQTAQSIIDQLRANADYVVVANWQPENGWPQAGDKMMDVWLACRPLLAVIDESDDIDACHEALTRLHRAINLVGGKADAWGGATILADSKSALKIMRALAEQTLKNMGDKIGDVDHNAAKLLPLWSQLIRQTQDSYRERKQADALMDFNDLERLTRDLLVSSAAVRERYQGAEFKHLLVDEFQDTNSVQWEIVRGLADIGRGGSLFVVGDPKQSIYQFRGADVSVFDQVREQITSVGGVDVALAQSFRTHKRLVDGFNRIFEDVLRRDSNSPVRQYEVELGEPMSAKRVDAPSEAAPIELLIIDKQVTDEKLDAEAMRRWEAYELAKRLKAIVDDEKRVVFDKEQSGFRPINYGDIAILFQSTSNILLYEDVFKVMRLPYVTLAGRGYYSRQEVWDLLNLLTALHNPGDNLALASALRSPLFGLSDDALLALRLQRDPQDLHKRLPLWDALQNLTGVPIDEHEQVIFARDCLTTLHAMAGRVSIVDLLQSALDETGYLAILTGLPDGARRRSNIEKLLDKAQTSRQVTLGAFSQYLKDLSVREVREGEALLDIGNSVTLMTVHASKGLEYPLVVLVDIGWSKGNSNTDPVMLDPEYGLVCKVYDVTEDKMVAGYGYQQAERLQNLREVAERKRLLYVAATRAQDYLLLSGQLKGGKDTWQSWLSTALKLEIELQAGTVMVEKDWGKLQVTAPAQPPPDDVLERRTDDDYDGWEQPQVKEMRLVEGDNRAPLTAAIHINQSETIRHITATQIADAGGARIDPILGRKFRRSVFQDAPITVEHITRQKSQEVSQRIIGEMVHKVLGWWDFKEEHAHFDDRLDSYAWELGVVDGRQRQNAVQHAHRLLDTMQTNQVYSWLSAAVQLYREIPFVYRSEKRIIHGVLDVLFQREDGSWVVLDYKTSHIAGYKPSGAETLLSNHALRYHLQIGVYAAAVREQLGGIVPDTYIYYIRYGRYVNVQQADWSNALNALEVTIGDLLVG